MKSVSVVLLICTFVPALLAAPTKIRRSPTWCAEDGNTYGLMDYPDSAFVAYVGGNGDELRGRYDKAGVAIFTRLRKSTVIDEFRITGMENPNGWITQSERGKWFAITWSNAGATGGWTAQIFHFSSEGKFVEDKAIRLKVERNFSSKHNCAARGDSYQALRWLDKDHLLLTAEVYPTSDCGSQMGFTQGYIINVETSSIEKRLSEQQRKSPANLHMELHTVETAASLRMLDRLGHCLDSPLIADVAGKVHLHV